MNEPIIEFKDEKHAYECLEEWQRRLYLSDWIIRVSFEKIDKDRAAEIYTEHSQKSAKIRFNILTPERKESEPVRYCAEKIMVHELLHILFDIVRYDQSSLAENELELAQHIKTEFMARSLIMVKYDLDPDWFKNI